MFARRRPEPPHGRATDMMGLPMAMSEATPLCLNKGLHVNNAWRHGGLKRRSDVIRRRLQQPCQTHAPDAPTLDANALAVMQYPRAQEELSLRSQDRGHNLMSPLEGGA